MLQRTLKEEGVQVNTPNPGHFVAPGVAVIRYGARLGTRYDSFRPTKLVHQNGIPYGRCPGISDPYKFGG